VREGDPIDLYVMNAGIVLLGDQERRTSPSGSELHLATNFVGHYALTTGILPLLSAGGARVVAQCSSIAQLLDIDWNDVQCRRRYSPLRAYASSKVALGLFADELGRRSAAHGWGLTVKVSHPGIAPDTGIAGTVRERLTGSRVHTFVRRISNTPAQAAQPALMAAVADAAGASFFGPSGFLHLGGPAAPQRIYRHLVAPGGGERAWALGARLSGHPVPDADTMP
jgi:NAD(P)-dependent dehydrogenase (short-subunit alcohol dehydrogenase family)